MADTEFFAHAGAGASVEAAPGSTRRLLLHTAELMLVEFRFEPGAIGPLHSHPHVQASYVAAGSFEVTIDGATRTLNEGEAYIVPSNLVHGVKALSAGMLIDSFTPPRAEFLQASA